MLTYKYYIMLRYYIINVKHIDVKQIDEILIIYIIYYLS
jgi:hypothetical protein